jgi:peptidoglycan/LPS O-acetylase OafA/YrhL
MSFALRSAGSGTVGRGREEGPRVVATAERAAAPRTPGRHRPKTVARRTRPDRPARRVDLEGVRAVAVLGVVVYHLRPSWLPGGFAGVDVFFVLSGFFITGLLLREAQRTGRVDLAAFWGRRARRLLPAATLVAVSTMAVALVAVNSIDARRFAVDGAWVSVFSANWHYAQQGTSYLADPDPSPFTHYWSLGVEEQYYLFWPALVLAVALLTRRRWRLQPAVALVAVTLAAASFALSLHLTATDQPYAYFGTPARVWQLALGALLAATAELWEHPAGPSRILLRWAGLSAIVAFYLLAPLDITYPGWAAVIPAAGAAALVVSGGPGGNAREPTLCALVSAPAQALGRYSYSWYLWHWPPLVLLPAALDRRLTGGELVTCAAATLAVAVASYHFVENPVRTNPRLVAGTARSLLVGAALIVLTAGSAAGVGARAGYVNAHSGIRAADGHLLVPQPGAAAVEAPRPQTDGCEVVAASAGRSPECRYLDDHGHGDVVLVGDSHAVQWEPALERVARRRDWGLRVWTRQSCPFADVGKPVNGALNRCNAWRDDVTRRILIGEPTLVVVAEYDSVPLKMIDNTTHRWVAGERAAATFVAGLTRQLQRLRQAGIPVLVIRDDPRLAESGPKCVLDHPAELDRCSVPRTAGLPALIEESAVAAVPGTHLLDVNDRLCTATTCHAVSGNVLAYRDDNHLTVEFVQSEVGRLGAAADRAVEA